MTDGYTTIQWLYNGIVWTSAMIFAWLDIDCNVFIAFGVLIVIDYLTGLGKAYQLGHSITSNKMKYGIVSKLALVTVPITLAVAAKGLDKDADILLTASMSILIISEVYSIIGNYYSMTTGEEMPEYDAVAAIAKKLRTALIRMEGDKDD